MLEQVQNSNWGTVKVYSTERLIALAVPGARPSDFFHFVPPKPPDQRFPIPMRVDPKTGAVREYKWVATDEESRSSQLADTMVLDLWAEVLGDSSEQFANIQNSAVSVWVEVEWGSGGTLMTARVDVGRGTQLVIPADAITCRLGCDALPVGGDKSNIDWVPLPIQINAMVSRYAGAPVWKARKTEYVQALDDGNSVFVRVPSFAYALRMAGLRSVLNQAGIELFAVTNSSSVRFVLDSWTALMLKDPTDYVPLPNGTEFILVTNNTGDTLDFMSLVFALSL